MTDRSPAPLLTVSGLAKSFGHVHALRDATLDVRPGEVLGVLGDNGAGKSTLIKILSGVYRPDVGRITMHGQPVSFDSPRVASDAGIATVYQDLALVDTRDVSSNVFLGREHRRGPFLDRHRSERETANILQQLNLAIPARGVLVGMLSGGQRQAVAVARTLVGRADLIIMDEPTAALGITESAQVMKLVRDLRDRGKAIILISHNLEQIWDIADRFHVLRLGRSVGTRERSTATPGDIVHMIVYGDAQRADAQLPTTQ